MKIRFARWGAVALVIGGLVIGTFAPASVGAAAASDLEHSGSGGWATAPAAATYRATVAAPLDTAEVQALNEAINEEYLALNTYQAALKQFGDVLPFSYIVGSEQQHVSALSQLLAKYGFPIPANPGLTPTPTWNSLTSACQTGVDVEKADVALYDELLKATDNADLIRVFTNLQAASLNNHLPAFEACN